MKTIFFAITLFVFNGIATASSVCIVGTGIPEVVCDGAIVSKFMADESDYTRTACLKRLIDNGYKIASQTATTVPAVVSWTLVKY